MNTTEYTTIKLNDDQMRALFYALRTSSETVRDSGSELIESFEDRYEEIFAKLRKSGWDC
jgi:uncharacterized protein YutE (UPF0331/DUF86 family)